MDNEARNLIIGAIFGSLLPSIIKYVYALVARRTGAELAQESKKDDMFTDWVRNDKLLLTAAYQSAQDRARVLDEKVEHLLRQLSDEHASATALKTEREILTSQISEQRGRVAELAVQLSQLDTSWGKKVDAIETEHKLREEEYQAEVTETRLKYERQLKEMEGLHNEQIDRLSGEYQTMREILNALIHKVEDGDKRK